MTPPFRGNGTPLRPAARCLLAAWGLMLGAGFAVAATLEPDPRGYGTHQRLGLAPCSVRTFLGIPCPGCGMTTSFAHFVRGRPLQAARANATGLLLACVCLVQIPWTFASAWCGRAWGIDQPDFAVATLCVLLALAALSEWVLRLMLRPA